jgi:hypothetical protein
MSGRAQLFPSYDRVRVAGGYAARVYDRCKQWCVSVTALTLTHLSTRNAQPKDVIVVKSVTSIRKSVKAYHEF